jgi:hypothetical protein
VAAGHPFVSVLMTNGGQLTISGLGQVEASTALRTCPNVLVATNGVYRQDLIKGVVRDVGVDRVELAGAGPHFNPS